MPRCLSSSCKRTLWRSLCADSGPVQTGSKDFSNAREGMASPLAKRLFAIDGVTNVFFGSDFVTVTKNDDLAWSMLKPEVFAAIMEHFTSGALLSSPCIPGPAPQHGAASCCFAAGHSVAKGELAWICCGCVNGTHPQGAALSSIICPRATERLVGKVMTRLCVPH